MSEFAAVSGDAVPGRVQWRDTVAEFADSKVALSALTMLVLIVGIALLAPWISPQNPYDLNVFFDRNISYQSTLYFCHYPTNPLQTKKKFNVLKLLKKTHYFYIKCVMSVL